MRKSSSEYQECLAYWQWAQHYPIVKEFLIKHVNEGKRSKMTGHRLNMIGMRKGLPDYQLAIPNKTYYGFWLEMKKKEEKCKEKREEQVEWINKLRSIGHYANFAYGWEDAVDQTLGYINNRI